MVKDNNTGEKKKLNIITALRLGQTLGDVWQQSQIFNADPYLPEIDQYIEQRKAEVPGIEDKRVNDEYAFFKGQADLYERRGFDYEDVNLDYDKGGGTVRESGKPLWHGKDNSFVIAGPSNEIELWGGSGGIEKVKTEHEDQIAKKNIFFYDKNGLAVSMDTYDKKKSKFNHLQNEWNEADNTFVFKELKDGELGNPDQILPSSIVLGARKLHSDYLESAYTGIMSGAVSKTVNAAAASLRIMNVINSRIEALNPENIKAGITYNEIAQSSDLNKLANEMSNTAASLYHMNYDQSQGAFENFQSILFHSMDGVGQFLPMIASGYTLGALGLGRMAATQLSIATGSMTVYDLTYNDLIRKGYVAADADLMALTYGLITQLSENIFQSQIITNLGYKAGKKAMQKVSMNAMAKSIEEVGAKGTKVVGNPVEGLASKVRNEMPAKSLWANKYTRGLREGYYELINKGTIGGLAAKTVLGGVEEKLEEDFEGLAQSKVAAKYFNAAKKKYASINLDQLGGVTYGPQDPVTGLYPKYDKNNVFIEDVQGKQKDQEQAILKHSQGVVDGTLALDETFSWEDGYVAFISSVLTIGMSSGMSYRSNKNLNKADAATNDIAFAVAKNPEKIEGLIANIQSMADGKVIDQSLADKLKVTYVEEVMHRVELIKKFNLDSPDIQKAVGDQSLLNELFVAMKDNQDIDDALTFMNDNDMSVQENIDKASDLLSGMPNVTVSDAQKILPERKKANQVAIDALSTVKQNLLNPEVQATTSQRYTQKMNTYFAVDQLIKRVAEDAVREELKEKGEYTEGMELPIERVAEIEKAILAEPSKKIINMAIATENQRSVWEAMANALDVSTPEGLQAFIRHHNRVVEREQGDTERMTTLASEMIALKDKNDFTLPEEIVETNEKDKEGNPITKTIKAFNGNLEQAIKEIMNRSLVVDESKIESYINSGIKEALLNYALLAEEYFGNNAKMEYSQGVIDNLKANEGLGTYIQGIKGIVDKFKENLMIQGKGSDAINPLTDGLPRSLDKNIQGFNARKGYTSPTYEKIDPENPIGVNKITAQGYINSLMGDLHEQLVKDFENLNNAKEVKLSTVALISGMFETETAGKDNVSLNTLLQLLNQTIGQKEPLSNPEEIIFQLQTAQTLVAFIQGTFDLLDKVASQRIETLGSTKGKEHSIFQQRGEDLVINSTESRLVDKLLDNLNNQLSTWSIDKRLTQTSSRLNEVKVRIGGLNKNVHVLRTLLNMLTSKTALHTKESEKLEKNIVPYLNDISAIVKGVLKQVNPESVENLTDEMAYPELLFPIYHSSKEENGFKERILIDDALAQIKSKLIDLEEMHLSGKLNKVLDYIRETHYDKYMGGATSFKNTTPIYEFTSTDYNGQMSTRAFNEGAKMLDEYQSALEVEKMQGKKLSHPTAVFSATKEDHIRIQNMNTYRFLLYQQLSVSNQLGTEKVGTRRELMAPIMNYLSLTRGTMENVLTAEQLDVIVDVLTFLRSDNNSDWEKNANPLMLINNSLFVRGYPGVGKTQLIAKDVVFLNALLKGEPQHVTYVMLTNELKDMYKKQIEETNTLLGNSQSSAVIIPHFLLAHEVAISNQKAKDAFDEADFILYEEGSTLENPNEEAAKDSNKETPTGSLLNELQKEYGKKLIFLGDEGQVRSLKNFKPDQSIDETGNKTVPLAQIHRSSISILNSLFNTLRNSIVNKRDWEQVKYPKGMYKKDGDEGNVGLRYVDGKTQYEAMDKVVKHFIQARKDFPAKKIFLIVPSYENKDELLAEYGELGVSKDFVKVATYDAHLINQDEVSSNKKGYVSYNSSGLEADMVYLPFTMKSMKEKDASAILSPIKGEPIDYVTIMYTAASRARQYVEMVENDVESVDVQEKPLSGWKTDIQQDEDPLIQKDFEREAMYRYLSQIGVKEMPIRREEGAVVNPPETPFADDFTRVKSRMSFEGDYGHKREDFEEALKTVKEGTAKEDAKHASTFAVEFGEQERDTSKYTKEQLEGHNKAKVDRKAREAILNSAFEVLYGKTAESRAKAREILDEQVRAYRAPKKVVDKKTKKERMETTAETTRRQKAYSNRMLMLADMLAGDIGFEKENSISKPAIGVNINSQDWQGHPFSMNVIGYATRNGKQVPIVDIFSLTYSSQKLENKSGIAASHIYRILAEEKGYIVRDSKAVQFIDNIKDGETEITLSNGFEENGVISYREVRRKMGLDSTIDLKEKQQALNKAMFEKSRDIFEVETQSGRKFFLGDTVITNNTRDIIERIIVTNGIAQVELKELGIKPLSFLDENYKNNDQVTISNHPAQSAIFFVKENARRVTTLVFDERNKPQVSPNDYFNREKNLQFDIKMRIMRNLKNLGTDNKIERTFKKEIPLWSYSRKEKNEVVNHKNVFVLTLSKSQAETLEDLIITEIKKESKDLKGFKRGYIFENGLDLLGIELEAEFKPVNNKNFEENKQSNSKALNSIDSSKGRSFVQAEAKRILQNEFKNENLSEEEIDMIVQMNLTKFMDVWDIKQGKASERTVVTAYSTESPSVSPSREAYYTMFSEVDAQMEQDGFTAYDSSGNLNYRFSRKNGIFKLLVDYHNKYSGDDVTIEFDGDPITRLDRKTGKWISNVDAINRYVNDLKNDFKEKKEHFKSLLNALDKAYEMNGDVMSEHVKAAKSKMILDLFFNLEFLQFLRVNGKAFEGIINNSKVLQKYLSVRKYGEVYDTRIRETHFEKAISNMENLMSAFLDAVNKPTTNLESVRLHKPFIQMGISGKHIGVNTENVSANFSGTIQSFTLTSHPQEIKEDGTTSTSHVDEMDVEEQKDVAEEVKKEPIVSKKNAFASNTEEESDDLLKENNSKGRNTLYITRQKALDEISRIIGTSNASKFIGFSDGLIKLNGKTYWGVVRNGLMTLAESELGIENTTPRHESLHFVIEYLMPQNKRSKLMTAALKEMGGGKTYKQVHEYLADQFEYEKYKPTTLVGRFLQAIKTFLYESFGLFGKDIKTVLTSINDGSFADNDRVVRSGQMGDSYFKEVISDLDEDTTESFEVSKVENEFTVDEVYNAKVDKFGSSENIDYWAEKRLNPIVFGYMGMSKTYMMNKQAKMGGSKFKGLNTFEKAVQGAWEFIGFMHDRNMDMYGGSNTGLKFYDETSEEAQFVPYGEISKELYLRVQEFQKTQKRNEANGLKGHYHYQNNEDLLNAYVVQELKRKKSDTNTVSGRTLFMNLVQGTFTEVDLSRKSRNGGPVKTSKHNIIDEKDEVSPIKNMSTFLMAMFNFTRLRSYTENNGIVDDTYYGEDNYMDGYLVFNELLIAADNLRDEGIKVEIDTLFKKLQEKRDSLSNGILKNNLHTFLVEFGHEVAKEHLLKLDLLEKATTEAEVAAAQMKPEGVGKFKGFMTNMSGIGYYYIEKYLNPNKETNDQVKSNFIVPGYSDQVVDKIDEISKVSTMIENAVTGLISMRRIMVQMDRQRPIRTLNNNMSQIYQSEIREAMRSKFNTPNGTTQGYIWADFMPGEDQLFKVTPDSLEMRISPKGQEAVFQTIIKTSNLGKTEVSFATDQIGQIKKMISYIIAKDDLTNEITEKIIENDQAAKKFLTMYAKLYSNILNTQDFSKTKVIKPDEAPSYTKSEDSQIFDEYLDMYAVDTENNPLNLHHPLDEFTFIEKVVARNISNVMTRSNDLMQVMADGNAKQTREKAALFFDKLSSNTQEEGALASLKKEIEEDARTIQQTIPVGGKPYETAFVTISNDKIEWRDPVMKGIMTVAPLGTMPSIENGRVVMMDKQIGLYEYIRAYKELLRDNVKNNASEYYVFIEGTGDRSQIPVSRMGFGKRGSLFNVQHKKGFINMFGINTVPMVNVLKHFVESDRKMRTLAKARWEKETGLTVKDGIKILDSKGNMTKEAIKLRASNLTEFADYMVKDNKYVIGNQYSSEDSVYKMTDSEYAEWTVLANRLEKLNQAQEAGEVVILDIVDVSKAMFSILRDRHADRIDSLAKEIIGLKESDESNLDIDQDNVVTKFSAQRFGKIRNAFKVLSDLGQEEAYIEILTEVEKFKGNNINYTQAVELWDKTRSIYNTLKNEYKNEGKNGFEAQKTKDAIKTVRMNLIPDMFNKANDSYGMAQLMYWNHHIFNHSVNNNIRGNVENFKNLADYQKRGKSANAIGDPIIERFVGKNIRMLTVEDRMISDEVFSEIDKDLSTAGEVVLKKIKASDGLVPLNPILQELIYQATGSENGNVHRGGLKTIFYSYLPTQNRSKLIKMSMIAPRFEKMSDPFWRSAMLTMFGPVWNNNISNEKEFDIWVKEKAKAIKEEIKVQGFSPTMDKMIGFIAFHSTVKDGASKIQQLSKNPDGINMIDPLLNNEEAAEIIPSSGLRIQNSSGNFVWDNWKTIPTQILYILGVGTHNQDTVNNINNALAALTSLGVEKYKSITGKQAPGFIRQMASRAIQGSNETVKNARLINDGDISIDTWANKAISVLVSDANKYFKPTLPGATVVQYPYQDMVYQSEDDRVYTSGNEKGRAESTKRELNPLKFWRKEGGKLVAFESAGKLREFLKKGGKVIVTPQEVIMPFVHRDKFGITPRTSLADLMSVNFVKKGENAKADMRTPITQKIHDKSDKVLVNLKVITEGVSYADLTNTKKGIIHEDVIDFVLSKITNDEFNSFNQEGKREIFLKRVAQYYSQMNNALDVYAVRIPTTLAASGFPSRIIEFSDEYDNTVWVSPKKNILDGSDYDIDELHVYHKPMSQDIKKNAEGEIHPDEQLMYDSRKTIFTSIYDYYYDNNNIEAVLSRITTDKIEKLAEKEDLTAGDKFSLDLMSAAALRSISMAGKELVGHYANLQHSVSRMLHLTPTQRDNIFKSMNTPGSIKQNMSFEDMLDIISRISEMINAATDNDSLGGALGKIGFTAYTSNLIYGMVVAGNSIEQIVSVTTNEEIKKMADDYNRKKFTGYASKSPLKAILALKEKNKDDQAKVEEYDRWIKYISVGESIRRFTTIVGLQQGVKGTGWGLYSKSSQVEFALGQTMESFIAGQDASMEDQMNFIAEFQKNDGEMKSISDLEKRVRNAEITFSLHKLIRTMPQLMSYIELLSETKRVYKESFSVTPYNDFSKKVMGEADLKGFYSETSFKAMLAETEKVMLATFLAETKPKVSMLGKTYDMTNAKSKQDFVVDFVDFVKFLRKEETEKHKGNAFLFGNNSLSKRHSFGDIPIYNINASQGASRTTLLRLKESGFDMFDKDEKDLFRIYNLIVYGFSRKDGNMSGAIDEQIEKDFSTWAEKTSNKFGKTDPLEVIARTPNMLSSFSDKLYSFVRNGITQLGMFKEKISFKENSYQPLTVPYSPKISTYTGNGDLTSYSHKKIFRKLSLQDIEMLKVDETVSFHIPNHGVTKGEAEDIVTEKNRVNILHDEDEVLLQDGSLAKVEYDGTQNVKITLIKKASKPVVTHKPTAARNISSSVASGLVSQMVDKMKALFPNIKVALVNNDTTTLPGVASWIEENGITYINEDMITPETPVHEIRHLYLAFLKRVSIKDYNALRKAVIALLQNKDQFALQVAADHKYLGKDSMIEEVMVAYMNVKDEESLVNEYRRLEVSSGEQKGRSAWASVKDIISRAIRTVMNMIRDAMGFPSSVDLAHSTLKEFAQKSLDAINSGKQISGMTSGELSLLMSGVVTHKPNSISSVSGLFDWIFIKEGTKRVKDVQYEEQLLKNFNLILRERGNMDSFHTGTEETIPLQNLIYNSKAVRDFTDKVIARNEMFREKTITALENIEEFNSSTDQEGWLKRHYGTLDGEANISVTGFQVFLNQIAHIKNTKYVKLSDLDTELKTTNTVPAEFVDKDILVAIKYAMEGEVLVSLLDMENEILLDKGENMFSKLGINSTLSMKNVSLHKSKKDRSGLKLALLANMLMKNNSQIKVIEAGTANLFKGKFDSTKVRQQFYKTNLLHFNNQISKLGEIKEFTSLLSPAMNKWFQNKNIVTPVVNHAGFLMQFYTEEHIEQHSDISLTDELGNLSKNQQGKFYIKRMRQIMDEYNKEGQKLTPNAERELTLLRNAITAVSQRNVLNREINTHEAVNDFDMKWLGVQNIGEVNHILIQEQIIRAEKEIAEKVNKKKAVLHSILRDWKKATGKSFFTIRGYPIVDKSEYLYERLFDTIEKDGQVWRTGNFYTTDKVTSDMTQMEVDLAIRAKKKGLSQEELAAGKRLADYIDELMIENVMAYENSLEKQYGYNEKDKTFFNEDDARKALKERSRYHRGFMPVMNSTTAEKFARMSIMETMKQSLENVSDIENLFEDTPSKGNQESERVVVRLQDMLFSQIGYGVNGRGEGSDYGSSLREAALGIKFMGNEKGLAEWTLVDPKANGKLSYNVENILDYFTVATVRKPIIEENILPIINAVNVWLLNDAEKRGDANAKSLAEHITSFRDFQILNKRKMVGGKLLGQDRDKILGMASLIATPVVMLFNIGVPLLSATSNIASMVTAGIANRISGSAMFTDGDIRRAVGKLYSTDRKLVKGIAQMYGVIDSTEYELVHLAVNKLYDKQLISSYMSNYPNRLTDIESRLIVMAAQMIHDGSFDAHSLKDGVVTYNKKADKRWQGKSGKIMEQAMSDRMEGQGLSLDARGYDYSTANTLKALSDMYVVGEFDKNTSNAISNYSFFRAALSLNRWFTSRWMNAFGSAESFRAQGEILRTKLDEEGNELAYFEKLAGEGYANTGWKWMIYNLTNMNNPDKLKISDLDSWQKSNINRFGVIMGTIMTSVILNAILSQIKLGDDDKPLNEAFVPSTVFRGVNSLFAMLNAYELITRPFAGFQIIKGWFFDPYGDVNLSNMRNIVPGHKLAGMTNDLYEDYTGNPIIPDFN